MVLDMEVQLNQLRLFLLYSLTGVNESLGIVAKRLGVSKSSACVLLEHLSSTGILKKVSVSKASKGRPQNFYQWTPFGLDRFNRHISDLVNTPNGKYVLRFLSSLVELGRRMGKPLKRRAILVTIALLRSAGRSGIVSDQSVEKLSSSCSISLNSLILSIRELETLRLVRVIKGEASGKIFSSCMNIYALNMSHDCLLPETQKAVLYRFKPKYKDDRAYNEAELFFTIAKTFERKIGFLNLWAERERLFNENNPSYERRKLSRARKISKYNNQRGFLAICSKADKSIQLGLRQISLFMSVFDSDRSIEYLQAKFEEYASILLTNYWEQVGGTDEIKEMRGLITQQLTARYFLSRSSIDKVRARNFNTLIEWVYQVCHSMAKRVKMVLVEAGLEGQGARYSLLASKAYLSERLNFQLIVISNAELLGDSYSEKKIVERMDGAFMVI